MTRKGAIELRPYSAGVYIAALLLCLFFAWIDVGITPRHPYIDNWARPPLLLILFLYAAQATSRLLVPVASANLSRKLAAYSSFKTIVLWTQLGIVVLLLVGLIRGLHSELRLLANTLILSPFFLFDLFGKDYPYTRPGSSALKSASLWHDHLKPISSDHWGEH